MSLALKKITVITSVLATTAIPALAAAEGRDNPPEFMTWGFLALCALIILTQIVPLVRSLKKQSNVISEQTKAVEHQQ